MKASIWKGVALVMALVCILCFPIGVSAAAQGTNGDEMQVATAEKLEIHLGQEWAGVTFELKTDYGMYPGTIPVGEDGVLRLEIGGSSTYVLSCLSSEAEAPAPTDTIPEEITPSEETTTDKDELVEIEDVTPSEPADEENTVAGIPVSNLIMFSGGLLAAIGVLVGMNIWGKKKERPEIDEDDEI